MKTPPRRRALALGMLGLSAAAMVAAAPPDDVGEPGAERLLAAPAPAARAARPPKESAKPPGRVELERWNRAPATPAAPKAAADTADAAVGESKPAAAAPKADVVNAFASTSWYVPPPPAKPEPPPKPTAPPLPFTFMGRYEDATRATVVVMLVKGDRLYTVSAGDVIDDTYRIEKITDKSVELIYLPLHTKQSLPTGGA